MPRFDPGYGRCTDELGPRASCTAYSQEAAVNLGAVAIALALIAIGLAVVVWEMTRR